MRIEPKEGDAPGRDAMATLQVSITNVLRYVMARASVAELWGLQAYLSNLASRMAPVEAERFTYEEMPPALRQQMAEIERQTAMMRAQQTQENCTPAQYRQEG